MWLVPQVEFPGHSDVWSDQHQRTGGKCTQHNQIWIPFKIHERLLEFSLTRGGLKLLIRRHIESAEGCTMEGGAMFY